MARERLPTGGARTMPRSQDARSSTSRDTTITAPNADGWSATDWSPA
jgi:hypothetical protein